MTKFFCKFKKPFFCPLPQFRGQTFFEKLGCHAQLHIGFQHHAKILRHLIIQFQENSQTNGWREGWTDPIS